MKVYILVLIALLVSACGNSKPIRAEYAARGGDEGRDLEQHIQASADDDDDDHDEEEDEDHDYDDEDDDHDEEEDEDHDD